MRRFLIFLALGFWLALPLGGVGPDERVARADRLIADAEALEEEGQDAEGALVLQEAWVALGGASCEREPDPGHRWRCVLILDRLTAQATKAGRLESAEGWNQLALRLGPKVRPPLGELQALHRQSELARRCADDTVAMAAVRRAFSLAESLPEGEVRLRSWAMASLTALASGRKGLAIEALDRTATDLEEAGLAERAGQLRFLLAVLYQSADHEAAFQVQLQKAQALLEASGSDFAEGAEAVKIIARLAALDVGTPEYQELADRLKGDSTLAGQILAPMFGLFQDLDDWAEAATDLPPSAFIEMMESRLLEEMKDDPTGMVKALRLISEDRLHAAADFLAARAEAPVLRGDEPWFLSYLRLSRDLYQRVGSSAQARIQAEKLLRHAERRWMGAGVDELRRSSLEEFEEDYQSLVEILLAEGRVEEAFLVSERSRARSLLLLLSQERKPSHSRSVRSGLLEEQARIRRRLAEVQRREETGGVELPEAARLRAELAEVLIRLRLSPGSGPSPESEGFLPAVSVEALRRALPPETTLLSFFSGSQKVGVWVLTRAGLRWVETELPANSMKRVDELRRAMAAEVGIFSDSTRASEAILDPKGDPIDPKEARLRLGREIHQALMKPVIPYLRGQRLFLVPHRDLHYLPFAALQDGESGRYLAEDFVISLLPSASALPLLGRSVRGGAEGIALVLGGPRPSDPSLGDLAGAVEEARAVGDLWGAEPLLGQQATETALRLRASEAGLIHVAAHGVHRAGDPLFSYLALTPDAKNDGRLEMTEVFEELDLAGSPMVVLSACETALGQRSGGDEVVGLVRSFLTAGASSVVAVQWKIDDAASARLVRRFYVHLRGGASPARALAEAQRDILRSSGATEPYYWAGYGITAGPET